MEHFIIDIGNTRVKTAIFDNDTIVKQKNYELSQFTSEFSSISKPFKHGIISTVVELNPLISNPNFLILTDKTKIPISNQYLTPHTLGRDRLANVIGASAIENDTNGILIIDAGTCLKFDFIQNKTYYGGAISNGMQMRFKALNHYTDKLPLLEPQKINYLMGKDTHESILSGVLNGMKAEINGIISEYQNKYPEIKVFLTGADAYFFEKDIKNNIFVNTNLTFIGLNEILKFNVQ